MKRFLRNSHEVNEMTISYNAMVNNVADVNVAAS